MYDNDFTGFKFNGIHFTIFPYPGEPNTIKLTRVSDGDRYTKELLPQSQDATVNVPGGDGTYYFGTNFTGKPFVINFAFDDLSETDLRTLRQTLAKRNALAPLIFDEEPYKYWMVKCVGTPMLKTICFNGAETLERPEFGGPSSGDVGNLRVGDPFYEPFNYSSIGARVYKGEGTVEFVAYYPFARCGSNETSKWLDNYITTIPSSADLEAGKIYAPTKDQWSSAAGLLSAAGSTYDQVSTTGNAINNTLLYNPGDIEANITVWIGLVSSGQYPSTTKLIGIRNYGNYSATNPDYVLDTTGLNALWSTTVGTNQDTYLAYNTRTQLLEGYDATFNPTGNIYNRYIKPESNFTYVPFGESRLSVPNTLYIAKIEYDYIYY